MNFASDNAVGASPKILEALIRANPGAAPSYGADPWTARAEALLADVFERQVSIFLVSTGTAANALALSALCPPWGAIITHAESHILTDECGAPEAATGGAKVIGLAGRACKVTPNRLSAALAAFPEGSPHSAQPKVFSFSEATEAGTVYSAAEIAELADLAHARGLTVHMDGARFANAVASTRTRPADLTWRAGVDALSLGFTKGGALAAEAVVFFDPERASEMPYRRKRHGHLLSKGRFLGAQVAAMLEEERWLHLAERANDKAERLGRALAEVDGVRLAAPVQANEVFPVLPETVRNRLKAVGAVFHEWASPQLHADANVGSGEVLIRLVTSWATTDQEIDSLIAAARQ